MEKFCKHIEKVLAQHDYVIVPELGGFVIQHQCAQVFANRITPPLATIAFNPLMYHSDGLLAIEISRSQQISYRLAVEYIQKEIDSIKYKLNANGIAKLGNLGTLTQDEQENLQFQPAQNIYFLPMNLGLSDIFISPRQFKNLEDTNKITIQFPTSKFYKYAAAASIFFCLFFVSNRVSDVKQADYASLAPINFPKLIEETKIPTIDSIALQDSTLKDSIKPEIAKENIAKNAKATIEKDNDLKTNVAKDNIAKTKEVKEKTIKEPIAQEELKFHVVVASLANLSSAEIYCKTLRENKYDQAKVLTPTKNYRVAIQSFKDKNTALDYMETLRTSDTRFETAWVYCE